MSVQVMFQDVAEYGDRFRRIVAKQAHALGIEIPLEVFHYAPNERPKPGASSSRSLSVS